MWADLPESVALLVFDSLRGRGQGRRAAAKATAHCRAVCARWSKVGADDSLWQSLCLDDFDFRPGAEGAAWDSEAAATMLTRLNIGPVSGEAEQEVPTVALPALGMYIGWHRLELNLGEGPLSAPLYMRSAAAWNTVEVWCAANAPKVSDSFCPPTTPGAWTHMLRELQLVEYAEALRPLQMLLAVHDGQLTALDEMMDADTTVDQSQTAGIFAGVFGGYCAYDHLVCTRLFPLSRIVEWTKKLRTSPLLEGEQNGTLCVVAASFDLKKIFVLDAETGMVSMLSRSRSGPVQTAAVPESVVVGTDAVLCWMEEFARRVQSGVYQADRLVPDEPGSDGISIYERSPPGFTSTVTRGIRAEALCVFALEADSFIYSVRLRLLSPDEPGGLSAEDRGFITCQLESRHWAMHTATAEGGIEYVDGSGVVGKYPVLREGGHYRDDHQDRRCRLNHQVPKDMVVIGENVVAEQFVYQSMTGRGSTTAFGGRLRFVPGTLREPTGEPFDVEVKHIELVSRPSFIY